MKEGSISRSTVKTILMVIIAILSGIYVAQQMAGPVTPYLLGGKSYDNRSPIIQLGIVLLLSLGLSPCIYALLKYLFPEDLIKSIQSIFRKNLQNSSSIEAIPFYLLIVFVYGSVFIYVFMEWVFFVTKPSFLDSLELGEKIIIFFQTEWALFLPVLMLALLLLGVNLMRFSWTKKFTRIILLFIATFFLSITFLLLLDNFTYTLTGFGIVKTKGVWRFIYLLGFLLFFIATFRQISNAIFRMKHGQRILILSGTVFTISTVAILVGVLTKSDYSRGTTTDGPVQTPNILLVGTDALDAGHLSFYGYGRETTPFITSILDSALVMQNHFSNANNSAGSVGSIFNSKLTTRTKVAKHPDSFKGKDAYEHFPGILMDKGYRNYEITYAIYEDAINLNIKRGFHRASGVNLEENIVSRYFGNFLPDTVQFFIDNLEERVSDRLFHISYIRVMPDPFAFVNTPLRIEDETGRMPELLQIITESEQPYFAHIHLLGTHGPTYDPNSKTYSGDSSQSDEWMADFYDDAILDFDGYMKQIFSALESTDQLDHTVVILYTDHPRTRNTIEKIPSVFWFPKGQYAGIIYENTNNLDIAPTILDYMGLNKPDWMEGTSLINGELDPFRPIYGAIWRKPRTPGGKPPFYEFGNFRLTICQRYVDYQIIDGRWSSGYIQNYSGNCPTDSLPSIQEMQDILIARIKADGYDTAIMESSRR